MSIKIRPYNNGDATGIFSLFQKYTPYERDEKFWVWINRILSNSIISVAEVDGEIIGHYAILPRIFVSAEGKKFNSGLGIHAFVSPEWRKKVSIFSISGLAYELAKAEELDFVYGFPNENYRLIQEKLEKWKLVNQFNALRKKKNKKSGGLAFNWENISKVNYNDLFEINQLLEKENLNFHHFERDIHFWYKRYFLHPQNLYQIWKIKGDKKDGFIVLKKYTDKEEVKLHLIDFVLSSDYIIQDIISDIETKFYNEFDVLTFWPFDKSIKDILIKLGFNEEGFDSFFAVKILNENSDVSNLLNFNNWHLTMGDSDAF